MKDQKRVPSKFLEFLTRQLLKRQVTHIRIVQKMSQHSNTAAIALLRQLDRTASPLIFHLS